MAWVCSSHRCRCWIRLGLWLTKSLTLGRLHCHQCWIRLRLWLTKSLTLALLVASSSGLLQKGSMGEEIPSMEVWYPTYHISWVWIRCTGQTAQTALCLRLRSCAFSNSALLPGLGRQLSIRGVYQIGYFSKQLHTQIRHDPELSFSHIGRSSCKQYARYRSQISMSCVYTVNLFSCYNEIENVSA